jgi:hypothetical protein
VPPRDNLNDVVVKWVALLFRIPKVLGSNLGPTTGHPG